MEQTLEEFFHDFRQETLAEAEANSTYQLEAFMQAVSSTLVDTGFIEGFEHCHYRAARGMRVDGYWFNDEGALDLFIADFDCRLHLESLTRTEVDSSFKRLANFVAGAKHGTLNPDVTTPEYGLVQEIRSRGDAVRKINCFLFSERTLSDRLQALDDGEMEGVTTTYHIWDISRLQRQASSRGQQEVLDIDLTEMFGSGLPCLPAHLGADTYRSYLIVVRGEILAELYDRFGSRLLEQNVRSFLQARGNVNKGIRATIIREPAMFFAYNNGITATARKVDVRQGKAGLEITAIQDLQIVNGGQTTASLFHTGRRDKASLEQVFVQMKLSVIDSEEGERVVPKIAEYANTQNRVNAADFFSNHPFHIRIEECSRRIWAPPQRGLQRETKWFYERARGQYADAQSKLPASQQRGFRAHYPKAQMFTKTDLAKFENVWEDHPRFVNLGAQKNFARFAARIGSAWEKSPEDFNDHFFRRLIARAILFRHTEQLVSAQAWYTGGYRANIVVYALAVLGECAKRCRMAVDWRRLWNEQEVYDSLSEALGVAAEFVNEIITAPRTEISNVSEWCKTEACWTQIRARLPELESRVSKRFFDELVANDEHLSEHREARREQRMVDGITAQMQVVSVPSRTWKMILQEGTRRRLLATKESGCLQIATQMPDKIPTEAQCRVLLEVYSKLLNDGLDLPELS